MSFKNILSNNKNLDSSKLDAATNILYHNACGFINAKEVHSRLAAIGLDVDLRLWADNKIVVTNIETTECHEIEI